VVIHAPVSSATGPHLDNPVWSIGGSFRQSENGREALLDRDILEVSLSRDDIE